MTLLLFSSWSAFSQTDIVEPEVKLKRSRAIAVVKDLTRYDSLQVQFALCQQTNEEFLKRIEQKDKQLKEYVDSDRRKDLIISNYSALQSAENAKYSALERKYKKEVRAGRFKLVLMTSAIAYALYKMIR